MRVRVYVCVCVCVCVCVYVPEFYILKHSTEFYEASYEQYDTGGLHKILFLMQELRTFFWQHAVVQWVEAFLYKPKGRGFDSR